MKSQVMDSHDKALITGKVYGCTGMDTMMLAGYIQIIDQVQSSWIAHTRSLERLEKSDTLALLYSLAIRIHERHVASTEMVQYAHGRWTRYGRLRCDDSQLLRIGTSSGSLPVSCL